MTPTLLGLHHVSAIVSDAQKNIDFYTGTLGLRLVKLTVNFDDPRSYHLYYGDESGSPGSVITFFVWPGARPGRVGTGETSAVAFAVPRESLSYWHDRLASRGVTNVLEGARFNEKLLRFGDPDGMAVELVASARDDDPRKPWAKSDVPLERAIRGFHSVTLSLEGFELTSHLLAKTMGFKEVTDEGNRFRFAPTVTNGAAITFVDLVCQPDAARGKMGAGTIHHIAFRTPDDEQQLAWLEILRREKFNASPVMDRKYFHSIYFREPGDVLFEIATDSPGFTVDEPLEKLGSGLYLPPWLEPRRAELVSILPKVNLPNRK